MDKEGSMVIEAVPTPGVYILLFYFRGLSVLPVSVAQTCMSNSLGVSSEWLEGALGDEQGAAVRRC